MHLLAERLVFFFGAMIGFCERGSSQDRSNVANFAS